MRFVLYCILLGFFISFRATAQRPLNTDILSSTGYLVFLDEDVVVFLPDSFASVDYKLSDLQKVKGKQIRGDYSENMLNARKKAKVYSIRTRLYESSTKKHSIKAEKMLIVPVRIGYRPYKALEMGNENGTAYYYKGKEYTLRYIDDWNVGVEYIWFLK